MVPGIVVEAPKDLPAYEGLELAPCDLPVVIHIQLHEHLLLRRVAQAKAKLVEQLIKIGSEG